MSIPGVSTVFQIALIFDDDERDALAEMVNVLLRAGTSSFAVINGTATSMEGAVHLLLSPTSVARLIDAGWHLPTDPIAAGQDRKANVFFALHRSIKRRV